MPRPRKRVAVRFDVVRDRLVDHTSDDRREEVVDDLEVRTIDERDRIGVHVVHASILIACQARDHRDEPGFHQRDKDAGVHPVDVAAVSSLVEPVVVFVSSP